jgi:hypothetical protein
MIQGSEDRMRVRLSMADVLMSKPPRRKMLELLFSFNAEL